MGSVTTTPVPILVGSKVKVISTTNQAADRTVLVLLRGLGDPAEGYAWKSALIDQDVDDNNSVAVDILGYEVVAIIVPTGWTASNMTFSVDPGNGTFYAVTGLTLVTPTANEVTFLIGRAHV